MPSIMMSGLPPSEIERLPRSCIETPAPAAPLDLVMSRPATRPWSDSMGLAEGVSLMASLFTEETAPVRSRFLTVP